MEDKFFFTICSDGYSLINDMPRVFELYEIESEEEGWAALEEFGFTKEEFEAEIQKLKPYNENTYYYPEESLSNPGVEEFITNLTQEFVAVDCVDHRTLIMSTQGGGQL